MRFLILLINCILLLSSANNVKNGFNLTNSSLPISEIKQGGPPKDGIPSIDKPKYIDSKLALKKFKADERALIIPSKKKAYPINILNWHEIVNESDFSVTFCPLCGTGVVFRSRLVGKKIDFGVSGLLYQSDVLMYDRKTSSLWSQLMGTAVSGKRKGEGLTIVPSLHINLHKYLKKNPDTKVLSLDTGYSRSYDRSPYSGYENSPRLYFPVKNSDDKYPKKMWSILLSYKSHKKIFTLNSPSLKSNKLSVRLGPKKFTLLINKAARELSCPTQDGLSCMTGYYFALKTFYPNAVVD